LRINHARNVALTDVTDFVSDNPCQFTFILRRNDQSRVYGNKASGNGKGVKRRINERIEKEIVGVSVGNAHEFVAQTVEILQRFGIV